MREKSHWTRNPNLQPILKPGQKCVVLGQSGSGKTVIGTHYLPYQPGKWVVFNPLNNPQLNSQGDKVIDFLPDAKYINRYRGTRLIVSKAIINETWDFLDSWVNHIYANSRSVGLFIDELNLFSNSTGISGPGMRNWCVMGRQKGLSLFALGQRPQMAPQSVLTEATYVCSTGLTSKRDWTNLDKACGAGDILGFPPSRNHTWRIALPAFTEYNILSAVTP